ncbi:MAG: polysaccharide deacetylase family protein [Defluviitaleaceae bacterium]|nr:polysaccharide deacetylase family protein [Defluviitaleaceae bacterium]
MKNIFVCCILALAFLGVPVPPQETKLPIIMYHLVTENQKYIGAFGISPAQLRQDFEYLQSNGYNTVVVSDLIAFVNEGVPLPPNPIMLTFDDGNYSEYKYLLPLLKEFDKKAVISIMGEATDRATAEAEKNPKSLHPNLNWAQVAELHNSGHAEIQSHAFDLHRPPLGSAKKKTESAETYKNRLKDDLQKLQTQCAHHLDGYMPTAFTYPFGAISADSREVLEALGMVASFSCEEGINTISDSLFKLKRINRTSKRSLESIMSYSLTTSMLYI